jgi:hypothetical protein
MKTTEEIIEFIAQRLGYIYRHRPLMYGGTAKGVDLLGYTYHELWAEIVERQKDNRDIQDQVSLEEDCNGSGFAGRYRRDHADASDEETVQYVIEHWRTISDRLGVPILHEEIIEDLRQSGGL